MHEPSPETKAELLAMALAVLYYSILVIGVMSSIYLVIRGPQ